MKDVATRPRECLFLPPLCLAVNPPSPRKDENWVMEDRDPAYTIYSVCFWVVFLFCFFTKSIRKRNRPAGLRVRGLVGLKPGRRFQEVSGPRRVHLRGSAGVMVGRGSQ